MEEASYRLFLKERGQDIPITDIEDILIAPKPQAGDTIFAMINGIRESFVVVSVETEREGKDEITEVIRYSVFVAILS